MRLFIEPTDVWLFRDGRPFNSGSDHRARSLFPPPPSVMQGALRAAHVVFRGVSMNHYINPQMSTQMVDDEIGKAGDDPPSTFHMRGPFIAERQASGDTVRYLPMPADVLNIAGMLRSAIAVTSKEKNVVTNWPQENDNLRLLWKPIEDTKPEDVEVHWVREDALNDYLMAASPEQQVIPAPAARESGDLFVRESRYGNELDYSVRRPSEGMLYEAEFIRPQRNIGLEVAVAIQNEGAWPDTGLLKLGGESHTARFYKLPVRNDKLPELPEQFKIYFATPTYFEKGWLPKKKEWSDFFDAKVELVAVALKGYESRGGYDLAKGHDKASRRYVPAGSVYYFKGRTKLRQELITDTQANLGFGQILIGRWF